MVADVFVAALAGHLLGDWFMQTSEMAAKKATEWSWAVIHALAVSGVLGFIVALTVPSRALGWNAVALLVVNAVTHAVIDRRTAIRWWMENVQEWRDPPFWGVLALDQSLHISIIALTTVVLW